MSRFKLALIASMVFLAIGPARADDPAAKAKTTAAAPAKQGVSFFNLLLGFTSWTEKVSVSNAKASDSAAANLFGNTITFEYERYPHVRWGSYWVGSILYGIANVGGSQGAVSYQLAGQTWLGAVLSYRGGYRLHKSVTFTLGPLLLYRSLNLPGSDAGVSVSSGASLNYGLTADMRIRLGEKWELRQELGRLMVNATTYWSLGFGYKF